MRLSLTALLFCAFLAVPWLLNALGGRRHRYETARAAALMVEFRSMVAAVDDAEFASRRDALLAKLR